MRKHGAMTAPADNPKEQNKLASAISLCCLAFCIVAADEDTT